MPETVKAYATPWTGLAISLLSIPFFIFIIPSALGIKICNDELSNHPMASWPSRLGRAISWVTLCSAIGIFLWVIIGHMLSTHLALW